MSMIDDLEVAIIGDLNRDSRIAQFPIRQRGALSSKAGDDQFGAIPARLVTTVSAIEGKQSAIGIPIKNVTVEVEIRTSLAIDSDDASSLLSGIEQAVSLRLEAVYYVVGAPNRLAAFNGPHHQVIGIIENAVVRGRSALEHWRIVQRTFIVTPLP